MLRLVLDTNVWLDWLVFHDAALKALREAREAGKVEIFVDDPCQDELLRVLAYDLGKYKLDLAAQKACLAVFKENSILFLKDEKQAYSLPRCTDRDDQKFLVLSAAARADALVTKDQALLELRKRVPFRIVSPTELNDLLSDAARA